MKTWHVVLIAAVTFWGLNIIGITNPLTFLGGTKSN